MTDSDLPAEWQSMAYDGKFLATFRMPGGSWKFLRAKGERLTFATDGEARAAAKRHVLTRLCPPLRGTLPATDKEVADKLGLEDWLRSKREDVKNQTAMHKAGRRPVIKLVGKAVRV